jgi:integrase
MWVERHSGAWRIRDRVAGRVVTITSGYDTKTAAKTAMVTLKAEQLRGDALVPRGGRILLREWVAVWQPSWEASLKPSAHHSEVGRLRNHVLPLLGACALEDIDALVVQRWVNGLAAGRGPWVSRGARKPLSAKTIRNCHGILHTILEAACAPTYRLIRANPCRSTTLPRWQRKEMRFLTDPEIARLIAALPVHWRPLILLLVGTGLRWGEAVGLRVGDVDLLARRPSVRVERTLLEQSSTAEIVFTDPKTKQSRRTVTITRAVVEALVALVAGRGRELLLFTAPMGGPARTRNFRRTWLKAVERAGLPGLRIHDLRHTHAAMLISAGTSLTAIQRRLGHSSIAVTSDLYGHLREEVDEALLAAIEEALAGVDMEAVVNEVADEMEDVLS